jgi:hypothetical protein
VGERNLNEFVKYSVVIFFQLCCGYLFDCLLNLFFSKSSILVSHFWLELMSEPVKAIPRNLEMLRHCHRCFALRWSETEIDILGNSGHWFSVKVRRLQ